MTGIWLPSGLHYDLHIEHRPARDAGEFTGGGNKWEWHTTESPWFAVDSMADVLIGKQAASQLLIGGRRGTRHPVVIQLAPLDHSGRALANDPSDGFETNRADAIQCEVCWFAAHSSELSEWHYRALANLVRLANIHLPNRLEVPPKLARRFKDTRRMSDREFVAASGHLGHMHTPDNDHTDPGTGFKGTVLMKKLATMPRKGWNL